MYVCLYVCLHIKGLIVVVLLKNPNVSTNLSENSTHMHPVGGGGGLF